jgi:hypothetical protein
MVFSGYSGFSSTNKTDHHDINEILLKVALNTMTLALFLRSVEHTNLDICFYYYHHWMDTSTGGPLVPKGIIRYIF